MNSSIDAAQCAAIEALQACIASYRVDGVPSEGSPGSKQSRVLEQALDYALSPNRKQPIAAFLEHDVRRHARAQVQRNGKAEAEALADLAQATAPEDQAFDGYVQANCYPGRESETREHRMASIHTMGPGGRVGGTQLVFPVTPEDSVVACDLEHRIRNQIRCQHGRVAVGVFDSMLAGDTVEETAQELSVSTRTVDRTRTKIRVIAMAAMGDREELAA